MSKDNVQSWDARQSRITPDNCDPSFSGQPVRIVVWDPAWPPQSEVPHKGTRWLDGISEVVVCTGVPVRRKWNGVYEFSVEAEYSDGSIGLPPLSALSPIPEKPKTASGEVVGKVHVRSREMPYADNPPIYTLPPGTYTIIREDR